MLGITHLKFRKVKKKLKISPICEEKNTKLGDFSKNTDIVEHSKLQRLWSALKIENFPAFEYFAIFQSSENQHFFKTMTGHHFEKGEIGCEII